MRWFFRSLIVLLALWAAFAVSPYLALYDLARALERRDVALIEQRVNFRALRVSLARELVDGYLAETDADGRITASERQMASGLVAGVGDPLLSELVNPAGLIGLFQSSESPTAGASGPRLGTQSWDDLFALMARSQTRGFRNVYFVLPPRAPTDRRFRVQLRLSRLSWKVVNLELPAALRQRLSREVAARAGTDLKR